jgi:hypothetical protein
MSSAEDLAWDALQEAAEDLSWDHYAIWCNPDLGGCDREIAVRLPSGNALDLAELQPCSCGAQAWAEL